MPINPRRNWHWRTLKELHRFVFLHGDRFLCQQMNCREGKRELTVTVVCPNLWVQTPGLIIEAGKDNLSSSVSRQKGNRLLKTGQFSLFFLLMIVPKYIFVYIFALNIFSLYPFLPKINLISTPKPPTTETTFLPMCFFTPHSSNTFLTIYVHDPHKVKQVQQKSRTPERPFIESGPGMS